MSLSQPRRASGTGASPRPDIRSWLLQNQMSVFAEKAGGNSTNSSPTTKGLHLSSPSDEEMHHKVIVAAAANASTTGGISHGGIPMSTSTTGLMVDIVNEVDNIDKINEESLNAWKKSHVELETKVDQAIEVLNHTKNEIEQSKFDRSATLDTTSNATKELLRAQVIALERLIKQQDTKINKLLQQHEDQKRDSAGLIDSYNVQVKALKRSLEKQTFQFLVAKKEFEDGKRIYSDQIVDLTGIINEMKQSYQAVLNEHVTKCRELQNAQINGHTSAVSREEFNQLVDKMSNIQEENTQLKEQLVHYQEGFRSYETTVAENIELKNTLTSLQDEWKKQADDFRTEVKQRKDEFKQVAEKYTAARNILVADKKDRTAANDQINRAIEDVLKKFEQVREVVTNHSSEMLAATDALNEDRTERTEAVNSVKQQLRDLQTKLTSLEDTVQKQSIDITTIIETATDNAITSKLEAQKKDLQDVIEQQNTKLATALNELENKTEEVVTSRSVPAIQELEVYVKNDIMKEINETKDSISAIKDSLQSQQKQHEVSQQGIQAKFEHKKQQFENLVKLIENHTNAIAEDKVATTTEIEEIKQMLKNYLIEMDTVKADVDSHNDLLHNLQDVMKNTIDEKTFQEELTMKMEAHRDTIARMINDIKKVQGDHELFAERTISFQSDVEQKLQCWYTWVESIEGVVQKTTESVEGLKLNSESNPIPIEIDVLRTEMRSIIEEVEKLKSEVDGHKSTVRNISEDIVNVREDRSVVSRDETAKLSEEWTSQFESQRSEFTALASELKKTKLDLYKMSSSNQQSQTFQAAIEQKLQCWYTWVESLESKVQDHDSELETAKTMIAKLKADTAELRKVFEDDVQVRKTETEKILDKLQTADDKVENVRSDVEYFQESNKAEMKGVLESNKKILERLKRELKEKENELQASIESLNGLLEKKKVGGVPSDIEKKLDTWTKQIERMERKINEQAKEVKQVMKERSILQTQLGEKEVAVTTMNKALEESNELLQASQWENRGLHVTITNLKQKQLKYKEKFDNLIRSHTRGIPATTQAPVSINGPNNTSSTIGSDPGKKQLNGPNSSGKQISSNNRNNDAPASPSGKYLDSSNPKSTSRTLPNSKIPAIVLMKSKDSVTSCDLELRE